MYKTRGQIQGFKWFTPSGTVDCELEATIFYVGFSQQLILYVFIHYAKACVTSHIFLHKTYKYPGFRVFSKLLYTILQKIVYKKVQLKFYRQQHPRVRVGIVDGDILATLFSIGFSIHYHIVHTYGLEILYICISHANPLGWSCSVPWTLEDKCA